ncbi:AraC family transcriptional regulator [Gorillibacterium timonense]|uniref:AraC family transcriptional regulator n=1 Tax=Gorillibacterium timonense TaxID=1689269 RepID=UPI00071DA75C|nr:AraC family transcriptional regulator [Gorillibacterium timonense]
MKAFHENRFYHSSLPFTAYLSHNISFLAHWHNDLEFVTVIEGSLRMGINSESRLLSAGDIAVCGSGDIHYYESLDSDSLVLIVIFNPQMIGSPGGWPTGIRLATPFFDEAVLSSPENEAFHRLVSRLLHELLDEAKHRTEQYEMIVTGLAYQLCGTILRFARCEPADLKRDKRRMMSMRVMQGVLDYLDSHYAEVITLEDAARQANMSLFHFSRFFKSITGMSFTSYLNNIRLNKAEELILSTNLSMLEIALESGFTNVRTFNRVFRQLRGRTPSDLR